MRPEFSGNTMADLVSAPTLPLTHSYLVMPDGVTDEAVAICAGDNCPREGATALLADPTLPVVESLGGIAGTTETAGGGLRGAAIGATTAGFGCNTAGSSSFTTGTCVQADNKIAAAASSAAMCDA